MMRKTAALTAVLVLVWTGSANADTAVRLPAPTGPHPVGVTTLHLVDRDRPDPWPDAQGRARELMATVFYPAHDVRGYPVAPQMTPKAAETFGWLDVTAAHPELPKSGVDWAAIKTHSHAGAPASPVRRPVLLYSPAAADPRTVNTTLAEDLASRGYVVVSFDHPGETGEVEFPGGRLRTIALPADPRTHPEVFRAMVDTRFVLDQLEVLARGGNPDVDGQLLPRHLPRAPPSTRRATSTTAPRSPDNRASCSRSAVTAWTARCCCSARTATATPATTARGRRCSRTVAAPPSAR
ncbi:hypothetical protein AB0I60_07775 [Actinosynnema sp. NPDC050436]|uniref:hypothetical protein n=1 Tax=Actinosynnema sp. NPDC050436 TaxID=3155659 RepID=UPI0033CFAE0D